MTDSKLSLDAARFAVDSGRMLNQPYRAYIERTDASKHMARFYAMAIEPTLFGEIRLTRCWGRIGTKGQTMTHSFEQEGDAVELFLELLSRKRKRGYRPRIQAA